MADAVGKDYADKADVERLRDDVGKQYGRIGKVEVQMAELKTEIPHIKLTVDKIDKRITWFGIFMLTAMLGFITTGVWLFVKFVLGSISGGS